MSIKVALQCSEGRFELSVDPTTSVKDTKRLFRKGFPNLNDVNMNAFVVSYMGAFVMEESTTLKGLKVEDGATLFLIRKRTIPSLNPRDGE